MTPRKFWLSAIGTALLLGGSSFPSQASEVEVLRAEVRALRARVAELEARVGGAASAASAPHPLRLSAGGIDAVLYGFLGSEAVWEHTRTGGDRFLNIVPREAQEGEDDFFLSAHHTRLGLRFRHPEIGLGWARSASGLLEIDFDTDDGGPRIRHAYVEVGRRELELLFGKTWAIVAQLNPETVNSDNLFNLGNVYERVPQLRARRAFSLGPGGARLEVGVLRFFGEFDQEGLALQPETSPFRIVSSSVPIGQARLAWQAQGEGPRIALSGSVGRLRLEDPDGRRQTVTHTLLAVEWVWPLLRRFELSGEAFVGRASAFNAGVGQTAVIDPDGDARAVRSRGGFVQLAYRATERLRCHLVYGIDDPENRVSGVELAIARNQTGLVNCFWQARPHLDLALELEAVRTEWGGADPFDADDVRVTQAVYLRF